MSNKNVWQLLMCLFSVVVMTLTGCGGGGGSSSSSTGVAKPTISGTVSFPNVNYLVGKQVALPVVKASTAPTVQLRDLSGKVLATVTATGDGTVGNPFTYSFTNLDTADYVVRAVSADGTKVVKALVDKNSLGTALTRDVDTISTTTIIVAENKLGIAAGIIGESSNSSVTTDSIANTVNPVALESSIKTAVNTVQYSAATASQNEISIVNLVNVVAAIVNTNANVAQVMSGAVGLSAQVNQYTLTSGGASGALTTVASVPTTASTAANTYTPPAADSVYYISKVYDYNASSTGTPVAGATVTTIGLPTNVSTITDVNGLYILAGIPQKTDFTVKMSKPAVGADAYSNTFQLAANLDTSDRPYALWNSTKLSGWGQSAGYGMIRSRVVLSTDLVNGSMGGVTVSAIDTADSTSYTVKYFENNGTVSSTLQTTNSANGNYIILNIPAGRTINVTATKAGYTFNTRTFTTVADAVCMARIVGTAGAATSPAKTIMSAGLYQVTSDSFNNSTEYYYSDRVYLDSNGTNLAQSVISYLDPISKTWTTTKPVGFPVNTGFEYYLTSAGAWATRSDGPSDFAISFSTDGTSTATITSVTSGQSAKITLTEVDISGQTVTSQAPYLYNLPMLSTAAVFPAGSARYDMTWDALTDDYTVRDSYSNSLGTDLTAIPNMFIAGTGMTVHIEGNTVTSYYAQFVGGASTTVNIYQNGNPTPVGTATYAISTVRGKSILEIVIPSALRNSLKLGNNPIFSVGPTSTIMVGSHSPVGINYNNGQNSVNLTAVNHLMANLDKSIAVPKTVVAKKLSKAVLGM